MTKKDTNLFVVLNLGLMKIRLVSASNTNALNLITFNGIAPHPIPLPSGERGG